ncbi:MAG: hypothetical protein CBC47_05480 [Alphaproteobacteria bacterium TMED87]|nr:hypothetical protein [Rhodospirillaceae bacterium]OUV09354.1 MAG: hypothetical protein CBC47_05480 [Alphaproteobacteria bacterium TMED87]
MKYHKFFLMSLIIILTFTKTVISETVILESEAKFLGKLSSKDLESQFSINVKLNGDIPLATYVSARFQNNQPKQRLANSLWIDWNERVETLQNNGFAPTENDMLIFDIFEEKLDYTFLPIIITISYLGHDSLKSGYYIIDQ